MIKIFKRVLNLIDKIDSVTSRMNDRLINVECIAEKNQSNIVEIQAGLKKIEKYEEINNLIQKINELTKENIKLKEENSIYLKYYDINSEATDEIKKEIFREFEMRRLQKTNETLEAQLNYARYTATAAGVTALSAYNSYRPWGY